MLESAHNQNPSRFGRSKNASSQISRDPARKKLWLWRLGVVIMPLLVIASAIGMTVVLGAMKDEPEEKEEVINAIPVLTATALSEDVTLTVDVQGEVQPRTEINLVPQVNGKITYMSPKFIEGGRFKKGDLLVQIDPREYELRLIQARANVAQSETVVTREKSESNLALSDWEDLGRSGAPTPLTLRAPQMAEAAAQLEAARAQVDEAQLQLDRASLYAPFTGRVTLRNVDAGEFVTAGTRLGEIYSTDIMDVKLPMTNDNLRQAGLRLGYEAGPNAPAIPVTLSANVAGLYSEWQGDIVRTDSRFDSETRVLFAYVEVKDPFGARYDMPLAPGLFVDASVTGQTLPSIVTIPRAALRGEDRVYIANADDTLSIRTVTVLSSDRNRAVIGDGLSAGESVITSPIRGVTEGKKISRATVSEAVQ